MFIKKNAKGYQCTVAPAFFMAKTALESVLDGLITGVKKRNSSVTLKGFGIFKNGYRKTRMGRNPQTGG